MNDIVYRNQWFSVVKDGKFHYIDESNKSGAVSVIKVQDSYIFTKAIRPANNGVYIECPRGYVEDNEPDFTTAIRETEEELGLKLLDYKIEKIGNVMPNSSILKSNIPIYLVTLNQYKYSSLDENESKGRIILNQQEIDDYILTGKVRCGLTLSALFMANKYIEYHNY